MLTSQEHNNNNNRLTASQRAKHSCQKRKHTVKLSSTSYSVCEALRKMKVIYSEENNMNSTVEENNNMNKRDSELVEVSVMTCDVVCIAVSE